MYQCTHHPSYQISTICIDSHQCHRKLCAKCDFQHQTQKRPLPIDVFLERLTEKVNEYQINDKSYQQSIKTALKSTLNQIEEMIKKLHQQLIESINKILDMIEIQDQYNPVESFNSNLDKLVEILEGNTLSDWDIQKKSLIGKFDIALNWIEREMKAYEQRFQVEMKEIQSIDKIEQKEQKQWEKSTQDKWVSNWDQFQSLHLYRKIKILIVFTQEQEVQYQKDGQIIRVYNSISLLAFNRDQNKEKIHPDLLYNLEQIKNLKWVGNYGTNQQKIGKWTVTWNGEILKDVGGQYSNNGKKDGQWVDIIKNYWSQAQVLEVGKYENGQRIGTWKFIQEDQAIGGGEYNWNGKNTKWIELSNEFWSRSQVTYKGEYKNNKKVDRWDILYREKGREKFEQIGGGLYDQGDQIKVGKWIELTDGFWDYSQITYNGDYKNGRRVGKWSIWYRNSKFEQIGGGSYDEEGLNKIGRWIEVRDGYWLGQQIIYNVGKWDTMFREWNKEKFEIIGGGSYEGGTQNKIGYWIELSDEFQSQSQITYNGQYKHGKKIGRWDIWYKDYWNGEREKIGGGSYDEGTSQKTGNWIELSNGSHSQSQIIFKGQYKNDKKVGKWEEIDLVGNLKLNEMNYNN